MVWLGFGVKLLSSGVSQAEDQVRLEDTKQQPTPPTLPSGNGPQDWLGQRGRGRREGEWRCSHPPGSPLGRYITQLWVWP